MTPEQVIADTRRGELLPVYLLVGEEHYLQSSALDAIRKAVIGGNDLGLKENQFVASETEVEAVLSAAKTLPMMAERRLVVVHQLERWEPRGDAKSAKDGNLDRLAEYAKNPASSATLVLTASKLDNRRRLVSAAKKAGYLVDCTAPNRGELPGWVTRAARARAKRLGPGVAELLAELLGPGLSPIDDALERLSLYIGEAEEITEDAVAECVVQVKPSTVWELVGAVAQRDLGAALTSLHRVYDPQDRGLRLLGVLAWSTRQLLRFASARREGLSANEAAKVAGAPPFKARQLAAQTKQLSMGEIERWLCLLGDVDLALKGGSRRPPLAVLETAIESMCQSAKKAPRGRASRNNGQPLTRSGQGASY